MKTSLTDQNIAVILGKLAGADALFLHTYPGDPAMRQPVHTVYGGAHLFRAGETLG